MPSTPRPELLAPAGDRESLVAAVENGCDAVYLGAQILSARASAANFTPDELADAIDYAHLRGVKAYVTVNTLVKDSETMDAADLLYHLDKSGADSVIVQDMGLLSLARSIVPGLPIHASTQMTVHNSEGARFLQAIGVKRVVLAREMTINEIKQVRQNTEIEIETFMHGALCISYSGQCLISSMIGGRSGNRGVCAQPCRKLYELRTAGRRVETDGEYLLSPKDLNASRILPELIDAGVDSLKIEGRLKRPEYVACAV
ncbi:MAG: U32 family peptidase, partial [Methanosarcinales archaeon]|nr:U32 family peptidase [Methanosarcinales archaeon]